MSGPTVDINSISNIFDSPRRQYFSLPYGLISYITQNPKSAPVFQKLQESCKLFFAKNKVIVVGTKIMLYHLKGNQYSYHQISKRKYARVNVNEIKIWMTGTFICQFGIPKNIYRYSLSDLRIHNQILKLTEFDCFLNGGKIMMLDLKNVSIINDEGNGNFVLCDKILSKVPNLEQLIYSNKNEIFTSKTFENMNLLKFNSKLQSIVMGFYHFSPTIDLSVLCKFLKQKASRYSCVLFYFCMDNSDDYFHTFRPMVKDQLLPWMKENNIYMGIYSDNERICLNDN